MAEGDFKLQPCTKAEAGGGNLAGRAPGPPHLIRTDDLYTEPNRTTPTTKSPHPSVLVRPS